MWLSHPVRTRSVPRVGISLTSLRSKTGTGHPNSRDLVAHAFEVFAETTDDAEAFTLLDRRFISTDNDRSSRFVYTSAIELREPEACVRRIA